MPIDRPTPPVRATHAPDGLAGAPASQQGVQASGGGAFASLLRGGIAGNERLTEVTGAVLIALLAVLGVTILRVQQLISLHLFLGMLLVPPVLLKMGSTGYRFTLYYAGNPRYRRKGPPQPLLRLLAPVVVVTTVAVFATGVVLLFAGPGSREPLLLLHKASFIVWVGATAIHVLAHLPAVGRGLGGEFGSSTLGGRLPGRSGRNLALAGAIVAGVVLAVILIPEFAPWEQYVSVFHGDH